LRTAQWYNEVAVIHLIHPTDGWPKQKRVPQPSRGFGGRLGILISYLIHLKSSGIAGQLTGLTQKLIYFGVRGGTFKRIVGSRRLQLVCDPLHQAKSGAHHRGAQAYPGDTDFLQLRY
jgi:hypothetical protein